LSEAIARHALDLGDFGFLESKQLQQHGNEAQITEIYFFVLIEMRDNYLFRVH
jgi:hypothetical protein